MKILAVRQPWAGLVVQGDKDIENRRWRTRYRGPVLIHSSQRPDAVTADDIKRQFGIELDYNDLLLGGIVGMTEIVDCVRDSKSRWAQAHHWQYVLRNSRPLPFTPWKGSLSITEAPPALLKLLGLESMSAVA
jgi:hypothetical protein